MASRTTNARITTTLSGVATEGQLAAMEERIMSALSDALASLQGAVDGLAGRTSTDRVAELERSLAEERAKYQALVAAEDAEDVSQNQELQDAMRRTDEVLNEMNMAAQQIQALSGQVSALSGSVADVPDETPVGEVEVPEAPPAPQPDPSPVVTDVPADGGAPDAGTPDVPADADAGTPTDGGTAPVDGPEGPTDAAGNPVAGPTV